MKYLIISLIAPNNRFNLTCPLARFVHLAALVHAQTAPIRFAERAAQVKQMLERPSGRGKDQEDVAFGED